MTRRFAAILLTAATVAAPQSPVALPVTLEKNLPLAEVRVNGGETLTFILDTAAANCVLDAERAAALGLKPSASAFSSGSGGMQQVGILSDVRLDLGGVRIAPPRVLTFNMKELGFQGRVDGIIGFPLFRRYVVEFDYPASRVRIFRAGSYRPPPGAQVLPLRMTTGPVVRGSIRVRGRDPIEADMQLDTGSAHIATFCTPFVDRHKLLEAADDLASGTTRGFGGSTADLAGRIEEVRIGRFAIPKPLVRFARQNTGSFATEQHYSVNVGGEFMKRYRVTFDIPGSRLILENTHASK